MKIDYNYRIIALDPGGTTGWATYTALWVPGIPSAFTYEMWDCGQMGPDKHHTQLKSWLGIQRLQRYTVVCERFDDRATGNAVNLAAKEYIGVVEQYCEEDAVYDLKMQMPGIAKSFSSNQNLKNLGLWKGNKWRHAMDAYRHLLWFMINGEPSRHDLLAKGWPNK
jgi:hypothetical protein